MDSHMTFLDFLVLALYFALAMGVGFYFYRRTRSRDGFTAASRSLPGWGRLVWRRWKSRSKCGSSTQTGWFVNGTHFSTCR